jgi:hypothetical protein
MENIKFEQDRILFNVNDINDIYKKSLSFNIKVKDENENIITIEQQDIKIFDDINIYE